MYECECIFLVLLRLSTCFILASSSPDTIHIATSLPFSLLEALTYHIPNVLSRLFKSVFAAAVFNSMFASPCSAQELRPGW